MGLLASIFGAPARTRLIKELVKHRLTLVPSLRAGALIELLKLAENMSAAEAMSMPEANLCAIVEGYADLRRKGIEHTRALLLIESHRSPLGSTGAVATMDLVEYLSYRLALECTAMPGMGDDWFKYTINELAARYQVALWPERATRCLTPALQASESAGTLEPSADDRGPVQRRLFNCPDCLRATQAELPPSGREITCPHCRAKFHSSKAVDLRSMPR